MPIYEYRCRSCSATFERRLKFEERLAAQLCPSCGQQNASVLMSVPAKVGGANGSSSAAADFGVCPSTGAPCGCGRAAHHY